MLDELVLLRLWAAPDAALGETRSRVAADLRPVAADPAAGEGAWRSLFAASVERLATAGDLTSGGRGGSRLRLTDAGRQRVQTRCGVPARPDAAKNRGWAWCRDRYALPLALDGDPAGNAEAIRVSLLRRFYLPELSGRGPADSLARTVDLLLAKRLKVGRASVAAFREAALREWVHRPATKAAPAGDATGHLPTDPARFAEAVVAAARGTTTGRFGENKVFVAHVWRELLAARHAAPEELDDFKRRLVRANTAGLLQLSRADLAGAHDAADVRASEIEFLGERFHFVRLD